MIEKKEKKEKREKKAAEPSIQPGIPIHPAKWVYPNLLMPLFGMTKASVDWYRKNGDWLEGKHCKMNPKGLWVYNWKEIESWMQGDVAA